MKKNTMSTAQIAVIMTVIMVISKGLGFVRELIIAYYYGAGVVVDAYVMAQNIPDTIIAAVISAIGTAFFPMLAQNNEKIGIEAGNRFASQMYNALLIANTVVFIISFVFAKPLVNAFAPGYTEEAKALTATFLQVIAFTLISNASIIVFEPYAKYKNGFIAVGLLDLTQSISIIIFTLISAYTSYYWLAGGVVVGYLIRGVGAKIIAKSKGFRYYRDFHFSDSLKDVITLSFPIFIGSVASHLNLFIDRMIASGLNEGSVSALSYGNLIVGVIGTFSYIIINTLIYPKLSQAYANDDMKRLETLANSGLNAIAVLTLPITIGAFTYSGMIIKCIYERGAFDQAATSLTAEVFRFYVLGVLFCGVSSLIANVFYAMYNTKTAVRCSLISIAVNIVLNLVLVNFLGAGGLALATSISGIINAALLYFAFNKHGKGIHLINSKRKILDICVYSIICVGGSYAFFHYAKPLIQLETIRLIIAWLLAIIAYILILYIKKFEEINILRNVFKLRS